MTTTTLKEINQSRTAAYASDDLRDLLNTKGLNDNDQVINLAYTDYGGDFFDKVTIAYFEKFHPENIIVESTSWYGQNAFIFGPIVQEFNEATENYLLGFENIEEFFTNMEESERYESAKSFLKDNPGLKFKGISIRWLTDWFSENANILTSGVDYSESRLLEAINSK